MRSSSAAEDSSQSSFAGLHESYVNVQGLEDILNKIKLVWASLWSDAALLYRQELGLSIECSTMPVIVQEMIFGEASGVAFTVSPNNSEELMIESVYGLCKGLVDGVVEPDRWNISRDDLKINSHYEPIRDMAIRPATRGVTKIQLSEDKKYTQPISDKRVKQIAEIALKIEKLFGEPQDIEWTIKKGDLYIIQTRSITTIKVKGDIREWYLSLRRSIENLVSLEDKISNQIIPEMISEVKVREKIALEDLDNDELIEEINFRENRLKYWNKVYWDEFIPMAHGVRLFGQIYNEHVKPDDPFEFTALLTGTDMLSLRRNKRIVEISKKLEDNPHLIEAVTNTNNSKKKINKLRNELYNLFGKYNMNLTEIISFLKRLTKGERKTKIKNKAKLKKYFESFPDEEREFAEKILKIARKSWKLRDDDNIILGNFEKLLKDSVNEAKKRLIKIGVKPIDELLEDEVILSLTTGKIIETAITRKEDRKAPFRPRQLVGQPAGPGMVTGPARVIHTEEDLLSFQKGEILVSDSIDPNMTFVVPLASGIIERRGGMLIHGAIIAREYGIACVTGIPNATEVIKTGDIVTVDGYLGIVDINKTK